MIYFLQKVKYKENHNKDPLWQLIIIDFILQIQLYYQAEFETKFNL